MAPAGRAAVILAALAATMLLAACGGGDDGESGTSAAADTGAANVDRPIRLTLTEHECAHDGPRFTGRRPGHVRAHLPQRRPPHLAGYVAAQLDVTG